MEEICKEIMSLPSASEAQDHQTTKVANDLTGARRDTFHGGWFRISLVVQCLSAPRQGASGCHSPPPPSPYQKYPQTQAMIRETPMELKTESDRV